MQQGKPKSLGSAIPGEPRARKRAVAVCPVSNRHAEALSANTAKASPFACSGPCLQGRRVAEPVSGPRFLIRLGRVKTQEFTTRSQGFSS
ncbi:MAG: hypothetical protein OXI37_06790, partial [Gammaproteobacteria bacterium]|nr:hypothetical protein [Gammaproteobacteria bacterium]